MWSEPRRAHPAGMILYVGRSLAALSAPVIALFVAYDAAGDHPRFAIGALLVAFLVVVAVIAGVVIAWAQWRRFTFHIDGGALRVEQGLLIRKSTRLTPERIQSIDTKANLLFRVLGLVTVDIHTAGKGQEPEASISALPEEEARLFAEALRGRVPAPGAGTDAAAESLESGGVQGSTAEPGSEPGQGADGQAVDAGVPARRPVEGATWTLTGREMLIVAVTSNAPVIALAAVGPLIGALVPMLPEEVLTAWLPDSFGVVALVLLAFSGLVVLGVAWVFGSVATLLQYWDFITSRADGEVRVEQGLLQRNTRNVPLDRVQAVRLVEGPLRQMIGRVTVGVDSAGLAAGSELGPTVLHPLLTRSDAARFCDLMVPGHERPRLAPVPERSRRRYLVRATWLPLIVALPVSVLLPWGWLSVVLPAIGAGWALLAHSDAAWGVSGDVLSLRWRGFGRTTALVRRRRIQSVSVSQHPLQKRAGLATLSVQVAASPQTAVFTVFHLDEKDAMGVLEWVSEGVERTEPLPDLIEAEHPGESV